MKLQNFTSQFVVLVLECVINCNGFVFILEFTTVMTTAFLQFYCSSTRKVGVLCSIWHFVFPFFSSFLHLCYKTTISNQGMIWANCFGKIFLCHQSLAFMNTVCNTIMIHVITNRASSIMSLYQANSEAKESDI